MARVLRDQVGMQDRVNPSFGADHLFKNAHAFGGLTPSPLGVVVRNPDLWQKAAGVKLGQDHCVDLVGLNPGIGDRPNHSRVRDDHALDEGSEDPLDGRAVAGGFDDDLVLTGERLRELDEPVVNQIDPLLPLDLPVLQERRLRERAMNIHADDRHDSSHHLLREPAGLHDIYGSALAAQPGKS